jgi:heterodisulfide reductase subunit D
MRLKIRMSKLENIKKQWKAIMSCMNCGDCGYAIRPAVGRFLTCPVKEAKGEEGWEIWFSRGRMSVLKSILEGKLELNQDLAEYVYQCTECGSCTEVCHQTHNPNIVLNTSKWIEHVEVWDALRRDLIEAGFAPLERHAKLIEYMNNSSMKNPYGEPKEKKHEWIEEVEGISKTADVVFFAGCTEPLRQKETLINLAKIFNATGKEFAVIDDEWCCGSIALRVGDVKSVIENIEHNLDQIKKTSATKLFAACAGCYRTIKKDWPEIIDGELPFEVINVTEVLLDLINDGNLKIPETDAEVVNVVYHDPCHLGRHMGLYDPPRDLIKKIPNTNLVELKRNRQNAWCCGAGGGVKSQFSDLALDIASNRIDEVIESGISVLLTACPFCVGNLSDCVKNRDENIKVLDIIDYIASKL